MRKISELLLAEAISLLFVGFVFLAPVVPVERSSYSLGGCPTTFVHWSDLESLGYRLFGMGYHTSLLPSYTEDSSTYCGQYWQGL